MRPTPPGTGVIHEHFGATCSKSTSPTILPFSSRLIPTSTSTTPGLTISAVTKPGIPTATIMMSALRVCSISSARGVSIWVRVTVALPISKSLASIIEIGLPTMFERPITTWHFWAFMESSGKTGKYRHYWNCGVLNTPARMYFHLRWQWIRMFLK